MFAFRKNTLFLCNRFACRVTKFLIVKICFFNVGAYSNQVIRKDSGVSSFDHLLFMGQSIRFVVCEVAENAIKSTIILSFMLV